MDVRHEAWHGRYAHIHTNQRARKKGSTRQRLCSYLIYNWRELSMLKNRNGFSSTKNGGAISLRPTKWFNRIVFGFSFLIRALTGTKFDFVVFGRRPQSSPCAIYVLNWYAMWTNARRLYIGINEEFNVDPVGQKRFAIHAKQIKGIPILNRWLSSIHRNCRGTRSTTSQSNIRKQKCKEATRGREREIESGEFTKKICISCLLRKQRSLPMEIQFYNINESAYQMENIFVESF